MTTSAKPWIGMRLAPDEGQKLDTLAKQTGRTMASVLRVLLQQTQLAPTPDILAGSFYMAQLSSPPDAAAESR